MATVVRRKHAYPTTEEFSDAVDVALKVLLGVFVRSRNHLGEIDDDGFSLIRDHYVELIEVAVDHPVVGKLQDQVHQFVVEVRSVRHLADILERVPLN